MPIAYALFALISGTLTYGTSVRLEFPLWIAAQLSLVGANVGVGIAVMILASRWR